MSDPTTPITEPLDILPLFGTVIYPCTVTPLALTQPNIVRAFADTPSPRQRIGVVALRPASQRPAVVQQSDCYSIGTVAMVHRLLRLADGTFRVAVEGLECCHIQSLVPSDALLPGTVQIIPEPVLTVDQHDEALERLKRGAVAWAEQFPGMSQSLLSDIFAEDDPRRLAFLVAHGVLTQRPLVERQEVLALPSTAARIAWLLGFLEQRVTIASPDAPYQAAVPTLVAPPPLRDPGTALWLRHTAHGTDAVDIEALHMPGRGDLTITGDQSQQATDAVRIAVSWARAYVAQRGDATLDYLAADWHIHLPLGTPTDELATVSSVAAVAFIGLLLERARVATATVVGELTLHGRLLPVGRLREKLGLLQWAGVDTLVLAPAHAEEVATFAAELTQHVRFVFAEQLDQALDELLA